MITIAPMKDKIKAFIALGTNDGNRESNIQTALEEIAQFAEITQKSSIYNAEPVGFKDQPDFLNMVIEIKTELNPVELMIKLEEIEHKMGKNKEFENGPRLVDLDILFYDDKVVKYKDLEIPHPRLHQRNFVLTPLNEIAPKLIHPTLDKTIEYLKTNLKNSEKVEKWT